MTIDQQAKQFIEYTLVINDITYPIRAASDANLLSVIRDQVGLTGTKQGCDDCECGACMILVDDQPVNSCSFLAAQAQDRPITTVEGLSTNQLHPIQQAMLDHAGVQCGFCTPGMLMSACALLKANPNPDRDEIAIAISGNLCRCTGYTNIISAIGSAISKPNDQS